MSVNKVKSHNLLPTNLLIRIADFTFDIQEKKSRRLPERNDLLSNYIYCILECSGISKKGKINDILTIQGIFSVKINVTGMLSWSRQCTPFQVITGKIENGLEFLKIPQVLLLLLGLDLEYQPWNFKSQTNHI